MSKLFLVSIFMRQTGRFSIVSSVCIILHSPFHENLGVFGLLTQSGGKVLILLFIHHAEGFNTSPLGVVKRY